MRKKLLLVLGGIVGLLLALSVLAFFLIDPTKLVTEKKDALLKDVSEKIGREVKAGTVRASIGTTLSAQIGDVSVAGQEGKPPQLQIGSVDVRFSLLRALLSFGSDLTVEQFTVRGLVVRAARDAEGRWDFEDIQGKLAGAPKDDDKPDEPSKLPQQGPLQGARVAALSILGARLELDDKMLGRPLAVGDLDVKTSDVELGKPLKVSLTARLEDKNSAAPVHVDIDMRELPESLSFDPLPDVALAAKVTGVDLGPWGGLLPADAPAPSGGTLTADVKASSRSGGDEIAVDGKLELAKLVLRDAVSAVATAEEKAQAKRGTPLDATIDVSAAIDNKKPAYRITKLSIAGSGIDVSGTVDASGLSLAALDKADVKASAQDLSRLLSALPPSLGLPEALKVDGPLSAKLVGNPGDVDVEVNLDGARVRYLDVPEGGSAAEATAALFDKAAGKPLHVNLHGKKSAKALDVDQLALVLDTAKIGGTLSVPTDDDAPLVADVSSGGVELASLQGLVPPFREAIGRGQKVLGTVELKVKATSQGGKQQADAVVDLRSMDVNLQKTVVRGAGSIKLTAQPSGGDVGVAVIANLDGLSVQKWGDDNQLSLNKPSGVPLRLDVDAKKQKTSATIDKLALAIGKSTVTGKGTISKLDEKLPILDVDLGRVNVGFDDLKGAVPGAKKLPSGGRLSAAVKITGGASADAVHIAATDVDVAFGSSKLAGKVDVKRVNKPILDVDLATLNLAFDDVRPLSAATADLPAGGRLVGAFKIAGDTERDETVRTNLKIDSLTMDGSKITGAVQVKNLDKPSFILGLQADKLDVDKLRATFGSKDDAPAADKAKGKSNPHGLSKDTRALLKDVNGTGSISASRAIVKGIPVTNFKGKLVMTRGVAKFDALEFNLYGGSVTATGTLLDLPAERLGYDLKLDAKNVDLGAFVADQTKLGRIFTATVSPKLAVKGRGIGVGDFAITAEGPAELSFKSLSIASLDLLGPIADALGKSKKVGGMKMQTAGFDKGTTIDGGFTALTKFLGGKLKLDKPVETSTPLGKVVWEGAMGLDAGLDLKATVKLTPATVSRLTGNKVKLKDPVPVPLRIGGTWDKPQVTGVDVGDLVVAVVAQLGGKALEDAAGNVVDDLLNKDKDKDNDKKKKDKDKDKKKDDDKKAPKKAKP